MKFGDSRSNRCRYIRAAHFVMDERRTTPAYTGHHLRPKRHTAILLNKKPTSYLFVGQAQRHATKILHKAVEGGILDLFSNFEKFQPEVADDVISGADVEQLGMDVRIQFGDCGSYRSRDIDCLIL